MSALAIITRRKHEPRAATSRRGRGSLVATYLGTADYPIDLIFLERLSQRAVIAEP